MIELSFDDAVILLKENGVILYPTETFYGIGCKISSERAILQIFKTKKRLLAMPLPTIVGEIEQLFQYASVLKNIERDIVELASYFWPGPLTFILPAKKSVSDTLTGGTATIAMRQSSHPLAMALAKGVGEPIVSSSANISGGTPVIDIKDMNIDILQHVNGYITSPIAPLGGLPSTIISFEGNKSIKLLREGAISKTQLLEKNYIII